MILKTDLVIRNILDECVAIPTGAGAAQINGVISLTPSGELLLRKLQKGCELQDLVEALCEEYDVTREQAQADVLLFIQKLKDVNLL